MPDLDAKLDRTLNVLSGGLSGLAPESALHSIETWEAELQAAAKPEFTNIARDLAALRTELAGGLDGSVIGKLLQRLGQQTATVAGQAGDGTHAKLERLASLLIKAGSVLAPESAGRPTGLRGEPGPSGESLGGTGATASGLGTGSGV